MIDVPEYELARQEAWFNMLSEDPRITVNTPGPYDLFLDLDTEMDYLALPAKIGKLFEKTRLEIEVKHVLTSSSGLPHRHVYCKMKDPIEDPSIRFGIQMALGSDPVKEILSLQRLSLGIKPACVLVEGDWKGEIQDGR